MGSGWGDGLPSPAFGHVVISNGLSPENGACKGDVSQVYGLVPGDHVFSFDFRPNADCSIVPSWTWYAAAMPFPLQQVYVRTGVEPYEPANTPGYISVEGELQERRRALA